MAPGAKNLIFDLLSTLRRGTMPVAALVEAGALFGLAGNNVRVALARLLAAGSVERDERGRYRLGAAADPVNRQVGTWRRIDERVGPWPRGRWLAVHTAGLSEAARARRQRARALRFLGFAELAPGLCVRPANLRSGVDGAASELHALGLEPEAIVYGLSELLPEAEARARGLWDTDELARGYRRSLAAIRRSEDRLSGLEVGKAMVESFLLGGEVMRQLAFDPLLPDPIAPVAERDALVAALRRYDRLGRACWAPFLTRHGVPSLHAPADTRIADGAARLALH